MPSRRTVEWCLANIVARQTFSAIYTFLCRRSHKSWSVTWPWTTTMMNQPTNATQAKDRLYAQLAARVSNLSRAISQTADLCEHLQVDLHAMRMFAGLNAATWGLIWRVARCYWSSQRNRFMTVATQLNPDGDEHSVDEEQVAQSWVASILQLSRDADCIYSPQNK